MLARRPDREDLVRAANVVIVLMLIAAGCGDVAYDRQTAQQAQQAQCAETSGGEQGTADELSELMAEVIAPRICERVVGSFIGLPGDEAHEGPAGGLDPAVGRWWIRQCQADVVDGRLSVAISGSGWTWLDRETMGFRVRQYLRFDAATTFAASLHVGYDSRTRIASIWLRPEPGVTAEVRPQGLVRAEATGIFSSVLGGILSVTGSSADDRARAQAAEEGSQRLRDRFAAGFTVTYALDSEQMDFMLGQLERGQTPERPWPSNGAAWIVNERSAVWPAGMDVLGPIPDDAGPVTLDVELEEGQSASLRRVCADELGRWLDAAWNGTGSATPPGEVVSELTAAGTSRTLRLESRACRTLLMVTPGAQASIPSVLRYRVASVNAAAPTTNGAEQVAYQPGQAQYGTSSTVVGGGGPSAVRVEIRSASISDQTAGGGSWDVVGGDPDPFVVVISISHQREIDRSPSVDDTREVRFDRVLPGAIRIDDFPIRFMVYDEDVTSDELIGVADVDASAIRGTGVTELVLPLRSEGGRPATTGTLRVRLIPVQ